jgi:hypothetical protein
METRPEARPRREVARPRPGGGKAEPGLARDLAVLALSADEAARLRDALARASVAVDVAAPEGTVRVPARANRSLTLKKALELVSSWAASAGLRCLPLAYGEAVYVVVPPRRGEPPPARSPAEP